MSLAPTRAPLIREVECLLKAARDAAKASEAAGYGYHATLRQEMDRVARQLTDTFGARIDQRWDGARVTLDGITAGSTSGLSGALQNWLTAARKKENELGQGN